MLRSTNSWQNIRSDSQLWQCSTVSTVLFLASHPHTLSGNGRNPALSGRNCWAGSYPRCRSDVRLRYRESSHSWTFVASVSRAYDPIQSRIVGWRNKDYTYNTVCLLSPSVNYYVVLLLNMIIRTSGTEPKVRLLFAYPASCLTLALQIKYYLEGSGTDPTEVGRLLPRVVEELRNIWMEAKKNNLGIPASLHTWRMLPGWCSQKNYK